MTTTAINTANTTTHNNRRILPLAILLLTSALTGMSPWQAAEAQALPVVDTEELVRLGVRFEDSPSPESLLLANVNGYTAVNSRDERQLMMPFSARVESWKVNQSTHISKGTPLVSLHSHDALQFLQQQRRMQASAGLCHQRLKNLKERQQSGISSRLDVEEQTISCQQLDDDMRTGQEVLDHLPAAWRSSSSAEFSMNADTSGWLISILRGNGQLADENTGLATFWPDDALKIRADISVHLAARLQPGQTMQVIAHDNPQQTLNAEILEVGNVANPQGLVPVWLSVADQPLRPGQRWQIALRSADTGTVVPASARIRHQGKSMLFVRQPSGALEALTVEPIAEGNGQLLVNDPRLNNVEIAVQGSAALAALLAEAE